MSRVPEPELERQGKRMTRPALLFLVIAGVLAVVGVVLLFVSSVWVLGIVLIALAIPPATVGSGLLTASGVSRWTARRKPLA